MPLATFVRKRIKAVGLSQKEIAERAGVTPGFISELVLGKKQTVQERNLAKLAYALGCTPDDLIEAMAERPRYAVYVDEDPQASRSIKKAARTPRSRPIATIGPELVSLPLLRSFPNDPMLFERPNAVETPERFPYAARSPADRNAIAFPYSAVARGRALWKETIYVAVPCTNFRILELILALCEFRRDTVTPLLGFFERMDDQFVYLRSRSSRTGHAIPRSAFRMALRVIASLDGEAID
ncbi:MAG: helix-turn-helix transcriptional regulator [Hyphomicrobiales bacterium]|nr:helix-turn-helix transcriptional regulator [Hyphomicrobiales bacterium]MCC2106742.1 helix-turn-helix transcriptional regulator [Hyphomicrobiales bacterium]HRY01697.1 helix-turn-helix transcriptional regulator [Beijerinckiaceae bacterium]